MSTRLTRPACHAPIPADLMPRGGEIACPACGKKLRLQARPKVPDPGPPGPAPATVPAPADPASAADVLPVAPDPAPPPAAAKRRAKGKRKRKKKAKHRESILSRIDPKLVTIGGVGLAVVLLLVCGGVTVGFLLHRGAAGAGGGNFVVVDTPEPGVAAGAVEPLAPELVEAPAPGKDREEAPPPRQVVRAEEAPPPPAAESKPA
jgi:DNA-directed RNA polymerase subunit RPC12/RpoP